MLIGFFYALRAAGLPVSVKEFLTLLDALRQGVIGPSIDEFYQLARITLIKDETQFDKFDQAFAAYVHGIEQQAEQWRMLPEEWLRQLVDSVLSDEQKAAAPHMDWDELFETLKKRLEEQQERHEGGNKWIGTRGTSPFGHGGYNPQGIRIGGQSGQRKAVKVWEQREFKDYDSEVELGTRNIKVALRRLRKFAREGAADELDLPGTIRATAANAGWLDLKLQPERHNQVKVLLLMDVGGSMDDHVQRVQELFSAARAEFKHLEFYYFHNCVYEWLWQDNQRRFSHKHATWDVIRKYNRDYKLIFVGDATMGPYEITNQRGSVEYNNEEPGADWLQRLMHAFPHFVWINPEPQGMWEYQYSVRLIREIAQQRMVPLSLNGLESAMRLLSK